MSPVISHYVDVLKSFSNFSGRADRAEYWIFMMMSLLVVLVLSTIDSIVGIAFLGPLYCLIAIVPGLAVSVRRLHDTDRSGWWLLVCLVPLVGLLALLYFMILDGTRGGNQYGGRPNPVVQLPSVL